LSKDGWLEQEVNFSLVEDIISQKSTIVNTKVENLGPISGGIAREFEQHTNEPAILFRKYQAMLQRPSDHQRVTLNSTLGVWHLEKFL